MCNPVGGLGLTGGIVDIGGLYDCLAGIYFGQASDSILDKYSDIRRQKYNDIINPISSENIVRLFGQDPDKALENDDFLKMCKRAEADPEFMCEMQSGANILKHDFTQYYHRKDWARKDERLGGCEHRERVDLKAKAVAVSVTD